MTVQDRTALAESSRVGCTLLRADRAINDVHLVGAGVSRRPGKKDARRFRLATTTTTIAHHRRQLDSWPPVNRPKPRFLLNYHANSVKYILILHRPPGKTKLRARGIDRLGKLQVPT